VLREGRVGARRYLSLPDDLIRKAKGHAAQRDSTVNELVRREEMHERR
jgi:hypothetical protein